MSFRKSLLGLLVITAVIVSACGAPAATPTPPSPPTVQAPTIAPTSVPPTAVPATIAPTAVPPTVVAPTTAPTQAKPTPVPPTKAPATTTTAPTAAPSAPALKLKDQVKDGFVGAFGWSKDNAVLTAQSEDAITQYSAADLKPMTLISPTFASQIMALSPDGMQVVGLAADNSVHVWDIPGGTVAASLELKDVPPAGAVWTPDGTMVATFSADNIEVDLWDAKTGMMVKALTGFETAAPVYSAIFAPDNKTMAWISRATVQFMDVDSGKLGTKLSFEDFVGGAQFTPDGKAFVTLDTKSGSSQPIGVVQVWNVADGKMLQELSDPGLFTALSVSPSGTWLVTSVDNSLKLWNWERGGDAVSADAPGQIATVKFSNDGKMIATGDQDSNVVTWSVTE